jgi:hypothetical protein
MASGGTSEAKKTLINLIALSIITGLDVLPLPLFGISGAAAGLTTAYLTATLHLVSRRCVSATGETKNAQKRPTRGSES